MGGKVSSCRLETSNSAFTLVELIAAIGIVVILASLAFPAYQHILRSRQSTQCLLNFREIGVGLVNYVQEHDGMMPTLQAGRRSRSEDVPVIDTVLAHYVENPSFFLCPADKKDGPATGTSYFWNVALNGQSIANLKFMGTNSDQRLIPVLSDKQGYHPYQTDKINVMYADWHVERGLKFSTSK
jgi:prepilin-type N-terminal cleavage/methylation domain-containing protein/prepilin-type processing-associated H-X9-DG protein